MLSMKIILAGAAGALLLSAAPAVGQTQPDGQKPAKQADPNRIVCERIKETGSRLNTRRVCMTAQQWEEQRRRDRENLQDAQQRSLEPNSG